MQYLIYSQVALAQALRDATLPTRIRRLFGVDFQLVESPLEPPGEAVLVVVAEPSSTPLSARILERAVSQNDTARAAQAEISGGTPGLGALAARCSWLWEVTLPNHNASNLRGALLATLAHACLGPVMTSDGTRLFGVRSARALDD